MLLDVGFSCMVSIIVSSFCFLFIKCFYCVKMWNFVILLLHWDDLGLFPFILLRWHITLINFCLLTHSQIPGINSTWSWCINLLMYCFGLLVFCSRFLSVFIKDICNFFCSVFACLWYQCKSFQNICWMQIPFQICDLQILSPILWLFTLFKVCFEAQVVFKILGGFLAVLHGLRDLSSLTSDWTQATAVKALKS